MVHLKSLEPPEPSSVPDLSNNAPPQESIAPTPQPQITPPPDPAPVSAIAEEASTSTGVQGGYVWSEVFTATLDKFISPAVMDKLKKMYEEGPEPPFVSDSGWGGRQAKQDESQVVKEPPAETTSKGGRGRGRGGRGGRGRDGGARVWKRGDSRGVVTEVCTFSLHIHVAKLGT